MVIAASIEVVLPTYNGVNYLEAQLASIYAQSLRPWRVLIRDDGSTDGTQELIEFLQSTYGSWLQVLPADGNLGCIANVNRLLEATQSSYVALADQDDIWQSDKLKVSLRLLQKLEQKYGADTALLVHSDLELVNSEGMLLGCRYFQRQRLDPLRTSTEDLAFTNVVTGCTILLNKFLLETALPIPPFALMHDWWLALSCSICGRIGYLDLPTVFYRQHKNNIVGSQGLSLLYFINGLRRLLFRNKSWIHSLLYQLHALEKRYDRKITDIGILVSLSRIQRFAVVIKYNHFKSICRHGPIRTAAFWLSLLIFKDEN